MPGDTSADTTPTTGDRTSQIPSTTFNRKQQEYAGETLTWAIDEKMPLALIPRKARCFGFNLRCIFNLF